MQIDFAPLETRAIVPPTNSLSCSHSLTHRSVHHVGLAVPQSLDGVEDVHHTLPLGHLAHNAAGAEHSAAATTIPVTRHTQSQWAW